MSKLQPYQRFIDEMLERRASQWCAYIRISKARTESLITLFSIARHTDNEELAKMADALDEEYGYKFVNREMLFAIPKKGFF